MLQNKKLVGYRAMLGLKQKDMAEILNISRQAYSEKERGNIRFKDNEMLLIKELFIKVNPVVTIDEIFFEHRVAKSVVERGELNGTQN